MSPRPTLTLLGLLLAGACAPDRTPTWAADTLSLEPGTDAPVAFQTWTLYGPKWNDRPSERFFACSVVLELELSPCEDATCACDACDVSWTVEGRAVDSDCESVPDLPVLEAVGLGPWPDALAQDERAEGAATGSWALYTNEDWLAHGWSDAGPEDLPAVATPAFAWPL